MDPNPSLPPYDAMGPPAPGASERGGRGRRSPQGTDDCELLRRIAAGDEAGLAALYDRWSTLVHSVAAQLLADPDDAAEVVGEVFWQAWRQAGRYREGRGAVSTWLGMMARSRALDRARSCRKARETESPLEPAALDALSGAEDPAQGAESAERRDMVARALGSLPADQREAVELAYFRGLSQSEIAAHTGQPLGTVKTRARLALQKLREKLSDLREAAP